MALMLAGIEKKCSKMSSGKRQMEDLPSTKTTPKKQARKQGNTVVIKNVDHSTVLMHTGQGNLYGGNESQ